MELAKVTFPLYKLRSYLDIEISPLGVTKITTIKGVFILDDTTLKGSFSERRMALINNYPKEKIYKLKEQVIYLRQLVKYRSSSVFVDYNGNLIKYNKSTNLFNITSHKIVNKREIGNNWTVISLKGVEQPFLVAQAFTGETMYASVMHTKWGPFLYDITTEQHMQYKRKI